MNKFIKINKLLLEGDPKIDDLGNTSFGPLDETLKNVNFYIIASLILYFFNFSYIFFN